MSNKGTDGKQEVPEISSTPFNFMIIYSIFINVISLSRLANGSKRNRKRKKKLEKNPREAWNNIHKKKSIFNDNRTRGSKTLLEF